MLQTISGRWQPTPVGGNTSLIMSTVINGNVGTAGLPVVQVLGLMSCSPMPQAIVPALGQTYSLLGWAVRAALYASLSRQAFFARKPRLYAGVTNEQLTGVEAMPATLTRSGGQAPPDVPLDEDVIYDGSQDVPVVVSPPTPVAPNLGTARSFPVPVPFRAGDALTFYLYMPPFVSGIDLAGGAGSASWAVAMASWQLSYDDGR